MNNNLEQIINQYKTDTESVYNTWFVNKSAIKKIMSFLFCVSCFFACHDKKNHPIACFTVANPVMALGDTIRIEFCGGPKNSREGEWNMGDTIYKGAVPLKHVYKAKGTYTIKLKSYEHMGGEKMFTHWQKQATSEAQQKVTVQKT